jgi:hypothetical protein
LPVRRDDKKRQHRYVDVALHDVPELTSEQRIKAGLELTEEQRIKAGLPVRRAAVSPCQPQLDPGDVAF